MTSYGDLFVFLYAVAAFNIGLSASGCVSQQADDCTSGFMSLDRMEAAVQGSSQSEDHVLGDLESYPHLNEQVIDPNIYFTCDGSILSWTLAAQRGGDSQVYTELQIWRSSGDGSYTKVGSTSVILVEEGSLFKITLTSPLPFQVGDILGFFQHDMSAHLLFEDVGSGHPLHYVIQDSPSNQFNIGDSSSFDGAHVLVNVETDPAGCDCGFVSVERMRIVLGLDTVGDRGAFAARQQITPDINFTCDGLITKWIVGADWPNLGNLYPELQVWRNTGNDVYHKMNSTVINITAQSLSRIYEYDNFSPIPVLAGDVLGVFQPLAGSRLILFSEIDNGPLTYYLSTNITITESPFDTVDLQSMSSLFSDVYHPLVTVEMIVSSPTSSVSLLSPASTEISKPTSLLSELVVTPSVSVTTKAVSTPNPQSSVNDVSLFIGVGVAGTLLVLITAAVIIIAMLVCLREKTNKLNITDNVAYQSSTSEVTLYSNAAYTASGDHDSTTHYQEYMYAATAATDVNISNAAHTCTSASAQTATDETSTYTTGSIIYTDGIYYVSASNEHDMSAENEIVASSNSAYMATDVATSTNQAYEATQHQSGNDTLAYEAYYMTSSTDGEHDVSTSNGAAYEITTSSNSAHIVTDAPTSTNQAYETVQYQSGSDTIAHEAYYMPSSTDEDSERTSNGEITTSSNSAYVATNVPTSTNQAYHTHQHQNGSDTLTYEAYYMSTNTDRVCDVPTSTDAVHEITTSSNSAYIATDVPTSTNQAYGNTQHHNRSDTLAYDYIIANSC